MPLSASLLTQELTLENGLRVIVREDRRTPSVCTALFHKIGTRHEGPDQKGLSYLAGGASFKDSAREKHIGAIANGWLDHDFSAYNLTAPSASTDSVFELLARRMAPPVLSQERLNAGLKRDAEIQAASTYFTSDVWTTEAFQHLIRGQVAPSTADKVAPPPSLNDVLSWHQKGYAPNNSILVVVGDISLEEVLPLAQRSFAEIPRSIETPVAPPILALPDTEERSITEWLDTEQPRLQMAFNTPDLAKTSDLKHTRCLQVICALLTLGPDAWLPGHLPEKARNALDSVYARPPTFMVGNDMLLISATANEHDNDALVRLQSAITHQLDTLKAAPLDAATLEYGCDQAIAAMQVYDTLEGQGTLIAQFQIIEKPLSLIDSGAQAIRNLSADDIQQAAIECFTPKNLSVAYIWPRSA